MRKWIWCATGLMVFSCAAMYLAAQHAAKHPDSFVASCFRGASMIGMRCNPLVVVTPARLPEPPRPVDKPVCQPICLMPDPIVPIDVGQEQPGISFPGIGEAPEVSEPIIVESEPPLTPDAEEPVADQPVEPVESSTTGDDVENLEQSDSNSAAEYGFDEPGPIMPTIADDSDEFEDVVAEAPECPTCGQEKKECCCCQGMLKLMKLMCGNEGCPDCCAKTLAELIAEYFEQLAGEEEATPETPVVPEDGTETPEDGQASENVDNPPDAADMPPGSETPMNPDEPQEPGANPDQHPAREDPHYHHHYPSCPYTGRCPYPYHYSVPRVDPVERPRSEQPSTPPATTEPSEPANPMDPMTPKPAKPVKKKKKLLFLLIGEAVSDGPYGVDTMECRPTDIDGKVKSPF